MSGFRSAPRLFLALLVMGPITQAGDPPRNFAELKKDHEAKSEAFNRRWEQVKSDADRDSLQAEVWAEIKVAANSAFAWSEANPDDPESIDAIVWTVHGLANGYYAEYDAEIRRAYELLTVRALADEKIAPLCYYSDSVAMSCPTARQFLEAALEKSPSKLIRGATCLGLARSEHITARLARRLRDPIMGEPLMKGWAKTPDRLEKLREVNPDEHDRRAAKFFERVVAEFGDVKMPRPYNQTPFTELARGELYALTDLVQGKLAPGLEGENIRGGKLRLEDFRGKVVAIVFWATWCGPCMAMVPHERELVKKMEGRPFVLLGVNGDEVGDREKAKKVMDEQSMTWPSLWNGGNTGGFVDQLGVRAWPTVYVLDAKGVIRYDNLRGESLARAVEKLVEEAEATTK